MSFEKCSGCCFEHCLKINECEIQINYEAWKIGDEYIARGVCSGCGARSFKEAHGRCRPKPLADTGDFTCEGMELWQDEE